MAKENAALHAFNRGIVSPQALGRTDIERMRLSAEEQTNWLPRTLGPMMLRPGLAYTGATSGNAANRDIPFVFGAQDVAILEFTASTLRPLVNEAPITRAAVSTTIAAFSGWTITATGSAVGVVDAGKLNMSCAALGGRAIAEAAVSVAAPDQAIEHAFRIVVDRGPVTFRVGAASGEDGVIRETVLGTGTHSLAFTPGGPTVYAQFETRDGAVRIVGSIVVEAAGALALPTPYGASDLPLLRYEQSGDVVYLACYGKQQRKVERRATRSWSVVLFESSDGPFAATPARSGLRLWVSSIYGNALLNSERPLFSASMVGSLVRLFTSGYALWFEVAAEDTFTPAIRVTGTGSDRAFTYSIAGTWAGTWRLQRSFDGPDSGFVDVASGTVNTSTSLSDSLNNSIVWYRLGFKGGEYTSGKAEMSLVWGGGGGNGIARITALVTTSQVEIEVVEPFTSLAKSADWRLQEWSDREGWPSAVKIHDGRLFWSGRDRTWGSVSDAYSSFDIELEGDAGPIQRSLGSGPAQVINDLLSLQRLIVLGELAEKSIRSSSFDEPLTPTNLTIKDCSTQGSARLPALKVDTRGIFVQAAGQTLFELAYSVDLNDYAARNLNQLLPDLCGPGVTIVDLAAQRQPDTRIHCILSDGTAAVLTYEPAEDVICWWRIETDGAIERVVVLPGTPEDKVYYTVARTVSGATVRYRERFAREDQCTGFPDARHADAHAVYSGVATTTIAGLSHLEGKSVVVWGWNTATPLLNDDGLAVGRDLGTFTVTGGQITGLSAAVTNACVGLAYEARYKSAKLAYAARLGTALTQVKTINYLGLILRNTHKGGLRYGQDFDTMDDLPGVEKGAVVGEHHVFEDYDEPSTALPGTWDTDARLCLKAASPRPAMVLAAVTSVTTNER